MAELMIVLTSAACSSGVLGSAGVSCASLSFPDTFVSNPDWDPDEAMSIEGTDSPPPQAAIAASAITEMHPSMRGILTQNPGVAQGPPSLAPGDPRRSSSSERRSGGILMDTVQCVFGDAVFSAGARRT